MSEQYRCDYCNKLVDEDDAVTTIDGNYVCDKDSCRTLDGDNEAHINLVSDKLQEIKLKTGEEFTIALKHEFTKHIANNAGCTVIEVSNEIMNHTILQLEQAQQEKQKLIEVVEHYADRNNHYVRIEYSGDADEEEFFSDIEVKYASDFGQKAQDILQEVQHGTSNES